MGKSVLITVAVLLTTAVGGFVVWFNEIRLPEPIWEPYITMAGLIAFSCGILWLFPAVSSLANEVDRRLFMSTPDDNAER